MPLDQNRFGASSAGFYKPPGDVKWRAQFPKIQMVTVEQLFQPVNPIQIPWQDTSVFKKTRREAGPTPQSELEV